MYRLDPYRELGFKFFVGEFLFLYLLEYGVLCCLVYECKFLIENKWYEKKLNKEFNMKINGTNGNCINFH